MTGRLDLATVAEAVRAASGICLRPHQYDSLGAAVTRALGGLDRLDPETALLPGSGALNRLLDEVAVKETTFLRDHEQLEAIDWPNLVGSVGRGDVTRIWSAGCATGEEVYSLAMLACEAFGSFEPPVRIIGTDLSETALARGRAGRYRERAMREVSSSLRHRYFSYDGQHHIVGDQLRQLVRFVRHNMVTDLAPPPGVAPCSLVVCRNVFIYFEPSTADIVLAAFARALGSTGAVILGAADALVAKERTARGATPPLRKENIGATRRGSASQSEPSISTTPRRPGSVDHNVSVDHSLSIDRSVAAAVAASQGRRQDALEHADAALANDPLNAHALLVRGLIALMSGEPSSAVPPLRAALYADPSFGLAAFMLGRAHDACGDTVQARRAYEQSLRTLEAGDRRHDHLLGQIELADVAAACRARLAAAI
jgi:chemotaxis protein methyltransferase CheR